MSMVSRTVVLVSDRLMFRKSFSKMIQVLDPSLSVRELSNSLPYTIELPSIDSGVIILDAGTSGEERVVEQLLSILSIQPEASIIVVLDEQHDLVVQSAMDTGALGVAIKAAPPQVLVDMLQRGLNGERVRPAPVMDIGREDIPEHMRKRLSVRQQKMLRLMIGGQSISATAGKLDVTPAKVVTEMRKVLSIVRGRHF